MIKLDELKAAAQEMVEIMSLDEELEENTSYENAEEFIKSAIKLIDPKTDSFTDETQKVIDSFNQEVKIEQPEADVQADAYQGLIDEIEDTETMFGLKEICKTNKMFKPLRSNLTKYKTKEDLKKDMLSVIENLDTKQEEIEKEEIAKVKKKVEHKKNMIKKAEKMRAAPRKKELYTRIDAVCETLINDKPKTMEEWAKLTDALYSSKVGRSSLRESMINCKYIGNALLHFGVESPYKKIEVG